MDPDRADGLFEPFRRLGQDRTSTSGHGLGLSIVASIAQAHTARVTARPETGRRTHRLSHVHRHLTTTWSIRLRRVRTGR
ncbi:ATP-binding protein [Streptomyces canus]|uniref:ATP-binding protein n=1 Tax=Streptomyces canus TaxID=58343 RepID=UPI003870111F|nr:ATP-binding protein [Streptomyces canus]